MTSFISEVGGVKGSGQNCSLVCDWYLNDWTSWGQTRFEVIIDYLGWLGGEEGGWKIRGSIRRDQRSQEKRYSTEDRGEDGRTGPCSRGRDKRV